MIESKYPLQIEVPVYRGRNALAIEVASPGPRCMHRPKTEYAWWLIENRPHHCEGDWSEFKPCTNENGCKGCHFEILDLDKRRYEWAENEQPVAD